MKLDFVRGYGQEPTMESVQTGARGCDRAVAGERKCVGSMSERSHGSVYSMTHTNTQPYRPLHVIVVRQISAKSVGWTNERVL